MSKAFQFDLEHIQDAAVWFWNQLGPVRVVALHGAMGAGKTSFVRALCTVKQVQDPVGSPSFSLVNEYKMPDGSLIFHMDLYRLKDEDEAIQAGIEELLYSGAYCFVEWPDKAPGIFPTNSHHVDIEVNSDQSRTIRWR